MTLQTKLAASKYGACALGLAFLLLAGAAQAQDPAQDPVPPEPTQPEPSGLASTPTQEWHTFSRNADRVYLADVSSITTLDDITTITVARVSRKPSSPANYSYSADEYAYRCATSEVRPGAEIEYGEDGIETGRFEGGVVWEPIRPETLDEYVKSMACDKARASPPVWPSIRAFMDGGRGG